MKKLLKNSIWLLLIIPAIFLFRNLIFGDLYYGGDAPYFYQNVLENLFSEPLAWVERGNSFGGINLTLWLSPVMFIYGTLAKFLSLNNDTILRTIFIIPSIILSFLGPLLLTKYLNLNRTIQFFTTLFYVFNTYYLLLLDGGQVGVALAYGIFPLTLMYLKKFVDKVNTNNFFLALIFSIILSVVDPRIFIVCFAVITFWSILEKKFSLWLVPLGFCLMLINAYWLYPFMKLSTDTYNTNSLNLGFISLINPLLLFSPHWPENLFGKINYPYFYFIFVPILIFGFLFIKREKKFLDLSLLFLVFAFLCKGQSAPFGIDLGIIFRDSSKFFLPVILFAGILAGNTIDLLKHNIYKVLAYLYILLLIYPAFLGKMNFMMSNKVDNEDYSKIAEQIVIGNQDFRTVWLTNRGPLTYESSVNPAIDGSGLVNFQPLASMNASEDQFNYLNNNRFVTWFKIFGIKYIFLNGDSRNIFPTQKDIENWDIIRSIFSKTLGIVKKDWNTSFPVYEISNPYPKFYSVNNLIAVIGSRDFGKDIYYPTLYLEDGKWDPATLTNKKPESLRLYFNNSVKEDLLMSLLQSYFISPLNYKRSQWSTFASNEYLKYKYQLLIRDFKYNDFDYQLGVAFSSENNESINFEVNVPSDGNYKVAKRVASYKDQKFTWQIEEKYLKKGKYKISIINNDNLLVLNTVALIPVLEYNNALKITDQLLNTFKVVTNIETIEQIKEIDIKNVGSSKYAFNNKNIGYWIIISDNHNPFWKLKRGLEYEASYPVYSMLNAFYIDPNWNNLSIEFTGQTMFRWGVWISLVTILILLIYYLYNKENEHI